MGSVLRESRFSRLVGMLAALLIVSASLSTSPDGVAASVILTGALALGATVVLVTRRRTAAVLAPAERCSAVEVHQGTVPSRQSNPDAAGRVRPRAPGGASRPA